MKIPFWVKVLAAIALAGALVSAKEAWEARIYQKGYDAADQAAKARENAISAAAALELASATESVLEKEREVRRAFDAVMVDRNKKEANYEATIADLRAAARAGAVRLSVGIDAGSIPGCTPGADPAAAGGTRREARADVLPEVADAVFSIAGDIAKGVRDYNRLLDLYAAARSACSAVGAP